MGLSVQGTGETTFWTMHCMHVRAPQATTKSKLWKPTWATSSPQVSSSTLTLPSTPAQTNNNIIIVTYVFIPVVMMHSRIHHVTVSNVKMNRFECHVR